MRYILYALSIFFALCSHAQVTVQNSTNLTVLPGTNVKVDGDLTIDDGGQINNFGSISFNSNLVNTGNTYIDGELVAVGDVQSISGRDSFAVNTLRINSTLGVSLKNKLSIINTLEFDRGILFSTGGNSVYFLHGAGSPNETIDGYIYGTAIMSPQDINASSLSFLGTTVATTSGNNIGEITIERTTGEEAITQIGTETSIASKWRIRQTEHNTADEEYNMTFSWLSVFDNDKEITTLGLYGTTSFDTSKYQFLDMKTNYPTQVDGFTGMRSYQRKGLNKIDRKFTLAGKNNQVTTLPDVHITTFPNPATDHINLLLENFESWAGDVVIKVTDAYGKVFQENVFILNGNLVTIKDIGFLPTGMYRLFISRGQLTKVVNFIKN